jgi:hypothetical protein
MDTETNGNGAVDVPIRGLKIGGIPIEIAAEQLSLWRERNPSQFGAYLAEAYTGVRPKAAREQA